MFNIINNDKVYIISLKVNRCFKLVWTDSNVLFKSALFRKTGQARCVPGYFTTFIGL